MVLADDGRLSFESHQDLSGYRLLRTPIWIFDVDRHQMWWGNRGALEFWGAKSIADLQARDFSSDSRIVRDRLRQIVMAEKPDLRIEESWTLFPLGKPTTVTAKILPVRIEDGRRGVSLKPPV